ncbi:Ricin B, lectin domain containing protein [Trema orientale]|uniref:Ricin B, lectin domain containing protein n=1 Tax=Trema orientale TaxID=63057 RepID=A0A2P5FRD6_TREOI|nr:Ricin B, lectin domain containing protein [Trema orientale]
MEFPFGHNHSHTHHHHRRDENEEDEQRRNYPPPGKTFDQPPPPQIPPPAAGVTHLHHSSHGRGPYDPSYPPPPRPEDFQNPPFPPPYDQRPPPFDSFDHRPDHGSTTVHHVGHHLDPPPPPIAEPDIDGGHHFGRPHLPSFVHHHTHQGPSSELSGKPTVKVFSKAEPNFSLTIRDGKVILAPSDPSDDFQHWYKDEKYSTRVKDEEGFPCFALVNKATGQAVKHSIGATHPVQLIPYNPNVLDESILWTEGKDLGDSFRAIRMVNNVRLNVDAFHGDKHSGGVHDGTIIVLWQWNKGDNQRWRITPYCKFPDT